ncbi:MAG TPA: hypothetical protein VF903_08495 [Nitrospirota bacterium]
MSLKQLSDLILRQVASAPELRVQLLLETVAGRLPEDGRDIVVQLLHHDRKPQLIVGLAQDLVEDEVLHERACDLGGRSRGAEIEGVLLLFDELVVDAVAELMRKGQRVMEFSRVVQEDIGGLGHEVVHAERAAVLAFFGVRVDLAVLDEPLEDRGEFPVEPAQDRMDEVRGFRIGIALGDFAVLRVPFVVFELSGPEQPRLERIIPDGDRKALRHRPDQRVHGPALDVVGKMPERVRPGRAAELVVDHLVLEDGIELGLGHFEVLAENVVERRSRGIPHSFLPAVHQADKLGERPRPCPAVLAGRRPLFPRQKPLRHPRPVRIGRGGLEVHDLFLGFAQVIARFREQPFQKMPVCSKGVMRKKMFLDVGRDPADPQMKELDVVLDLFAELLDLVKPGLELRIVLVLLTAEPEIVPFIAVAAALPLPLLVLVQRLPQGQRVLEVFGAVFPCVDECIALLLYPLSLFFHPGVVVARKERLQVPGGPFNF